MIILLLTPLAALIPATVVSSKSGPIASSGGVEIHRIEIERVRYGPTDVRSEMRLDLLFVYPDKFDTNPSTSRTAFLIHLLQLDPVKDDTGKLLSTKEREKDNKVLHTEMRPGSIILAPKAGPPLRLFFDAPAGAAKKIVSFKGKAKVIRAETKTLRYKSFEKVVGIPLKDAALEDVAIKPVLRTKRDPERAEVALQVTGKTERVAAWRLVKKGVEWQPDGGSVGQGGLPDGLEFNRGFAGRLPHDVGLEIDVLAPVESRIFEFEIKDIVLP